MHGPSRKRFALVAVALLALHGLLSSCAMSASAAADKDCDCDPARQIIPVAP